MKLGEILIRLGQITPKQLEAALRAQALAGGRLGTHLVELGFIGTDQLSLALSRQMGVPAALERHFSRADPAVVATLKANLAVRYLAVPLSAARDGSKQVAAALATPLDVPTLDDLSFALGARVEPMVAAEIVIARNIKRLYGAEAVIKPRQSVARPAPSSTPGPASEVVGRGRLGPRLVTPPASGTTPIGTKAQTPTSAPFAQPSGMRRQAAHVSTPDDLAGTRSRSGARLGTLSLEDALHRLTLAGSREQIAEIVIDFMGGYFGCAMIFLVRTGQARVWRGFAPNIQSAAIETIAFPLAMRSCFQIAHDGRASFRGPPPAEGAKLQRQIWKYLRCAEPSDVVVVPILVKERVLNLVYAHAADRGRLPDGPVTDLQALCAAASSVYVRMIQRLKEEEKTPHALAR